MLIVNSASARRSRAELRRAAATSLQRVFRGYKHRKRHAEIQSLSLIVAEFEEADKKAAKAASKAERKIIKKGRQAIVRGLKDHEGNQGSNRNDGFAHAAATIIQMTIRKYAFKGRVIRRMSVRAERQAIEDRRAQVEDKAQEQQRAQIEANITWGWTQLGKSSSCCSPDWEAIEDRPQKRLLPRHLRRVFSRSANMLCKQLVKGLLMLGSFVAMVEGSSSVTSSSIKPKKLEVDNMSMAIKTFTTIALVGTAIVYFNKNKSKNVLQDIDAAHPPEIAQFVEQLVTNFWCKETNAWKPDTSNRNCFFKDGTPKGHADLHTVYKNRFANVYNNHPKTKAKNDAQISSLFTRMLGKARGITREAQSAAASKDGIGRKRGEETHAHPNQQKKVRESLTCSDGKCGNTVSTPHHTLGLLCDQCARNQLKITITYNGRMTSPRWPDTTKDAVWNSRGSSWVTPLAYRIPTNLSEQEQREILSKLEGLKSSLACTICPTRGRDKSPNQCPFNMSNELIKCRECTDEVHDIKYSSTSSGFWGTGTKRYFTDYIDHDGTRMRYQRPDRYRTFPPHLYALPTLSNEATVAVAYEIEHKRKQTASKSSERRQVMYEQRRRVYQATRDYARKAYRKSLDHESISPREFIFRDPTNDQDDHAGRFVRRMGKEPFAYVHITAVAFNEQEMQAHSRDPEDPDNNFLMNRQDKDGLLTLKPNGVLTNDTIARILHLTDGVENNKDMQTWATVSLPRAVAFFERKYHGIYPLRRGFVGYAHFIYSNNERAVDYHQTVVRSPISGAVMVAPACQMLAGCKCHPDGPFVTPDLVLKFRCVNDSGDPKTFEWKVVKVDGQMMNIALDDPRLTADKFGITYTPGANAPAAAVDTAADVVDLTVDTP